MKSPRDAAPLDFDFDPNAFSLDGLHVDGFDESPEAQEAPDPLAAVQYSGNDEKDARAEYSELLKAFMDRRAKEADRFRLATDSEYWCAICFETREQKEAFLAALNLLRHGDKYLDGYLVAEKFGITLPAAAVPYNPGKAPDKKLAPLVIGAGE